MIEFESIGIVTDPPRHCSATAKKFSTGKFDDTDFPPPLSAILM
jgi:hypothetical protein